MVPKRLAIRMWKLPCSHKRLVSLWQDLDPTGVPTSLTDAGANGSASPGFTDLTRPATEHDFTGLSLYHTAPRRGLSLRGRVSWVSFETTFSLHQVLFVNHRVWSCYPFSHLATREMAPAGICSSNVTGAPEGGH